MSESEKHIFASNSSANEEILQAAMYSCCGRIIYNKWNEKEHKFDRRSHVVIPIDCGETSRGNEVLYAVDKNDGMQLKAFIIDQIRDFKNYHEKHGTTHPIQVDRIKQYFGIGDFKARDLEDMGMAAGARRERELVAKELRRIAQEIYEFSGCEGNLYSDRKRKDPNSYERVAYLNDSQRELVEHFTKSRAKGLAFGSYFKFNSAGRCYVPLKKNEEIQSLEDMDDQDSKEIFSILQQEGYVCPDYAAGYCYKESDKDFSSKNPPKVTTVLKKALRNDKQRYERLEKAFRERESGTMKRKGRLSMMMCITCNPEDIAGMSTDRDWTSCMRLPSSSNDVSMNDLKEVADNKVELEMYCLYYGIHGRKKTPIEEIASMYKDTTVQEVKAVVNEIDRNLAEGGQYYPTALKQVKYGGMVAYLIDERDKDIEHPYARLAVKRFENGAGGFMFRAEGRVYGDEYLARECGFYDSLVAELDKSNATTMAGDESIYRRNDVTSWSDSLQKDYYGNVTVEQMCRMPWNKVYDVMIEKAPGLTDKDLGRIIDGHKGDPPPIGIFSVFERRCGDISDDFVDKYGDLMDIDLYNLEHGMDSTDLIGLSPYKGNDAPRSQEEMNKFIKEALEDAIPSDDYGSVEEWDDEMRVSDGFGVWDDVLSYEDQLPSEAVSLWSNKLESSLREFYADKMHSSDSGDFAMKYPNFALFEEDYMDYNIDDDLLYEINEHLQSYPEDQIMYKVSISVTDVHDGYNDKNSVYELEGYVEYDIQDHDFLAYRAFAVVNTEADGWKEKISRLANDLFRALPRIKG